RATRAAGRIRPGCIPTPRWDRDGTTKVGTSWFRPVEARDRTEHHRQASWLELLFDLSFVAAVAQLAGHSLDTYADNFTEDVDATVLLRLADGADPADVTAEVERVLAEYPTAEVHDQAQAAAAMTQMLDSMLGLVMVLLLLAVLVALLGITNALALSI